MNKMNIWKRISSDSTIDFITQMNILLLTLLSPTPPELKSCERPSHFNGSGLWYVISVILLYKILMTSLALILLALMWETTGGDGDRMLRAPQWPAWSWERLWLTASAETALGNHLTSLESISSHSELRGESNHDSLECRFQMRSRCISSSPSLTRLVTYLQKCDNLAICYKFIHN